MSADMLANRIKSVSGSATLDITARAKEMKKKGIDVISLAAGEPDFPTPEHIKKALYKAVQENFTYYTPSAGIPELREAIAKKLNEENKILCSAGEVIVTPGAKQAIFEAVLSVVEHGEEVIIPEPRWVSYEPIVKMAEGKPVFIETRAEDGFKINIDLLKKKATPKTKLLIINSPSNPTGAVLTRKNFEEIADIAVEKDFFVLSDEIYEKIIYGEKHVSMASLNGMKDKVITVNGFSKAYSMTGWRIGYACASKQITDAMINMQSHSASNVTSFVQKAAIAAVIGDQECVRSMVSEFKKRRDILVKLLNEIENVTCTKPEGAFYAFPDFSHYEKDSVKLANRLLENAKVATIPGAAFGKSCAGNIRLSYAASMENIEEGVSRIRKALINL